MDWISLENNRDPDKVDWTDIAEEDSAFAIQFYDRLYGEYEIGGDIIPTRSGQFNISPIIWIKGKLLTIKKLREEYPDVADNVVDQMKANDTGHTVYVFNTFKAFVKDREIFWNNLGRKIYEERPVIKRNGDGTYESI